MVERPKFGRPPEKPRRPNSALSTVLSTFGFLNGAQAMAEAPAPVLKTPPMRVERSVLQKDENTAWFKTTLSTSAIPPRDFKRMEDLVLSDGIPLGLQISFMERVFGSGGQFTNEFFDKRLTPERLSVILKMVDRFSARLNRAYGLRDEIPAAVPLFNQVSNLEAATKVIRVPDANGSFCNSFFYVDEVHEVRQDTAAHCGMIDLMKMGYTVSRDGSDVATRVIANPAAVGIKDEDVLPIMRPMKFAEIYGKVGVSVSWSPRGEKKVQFSVIMPLTERVQELTLEATPTKPSSYYRGRVFLLKPKVEGAVIGKNRLTDAVILEASGSSGSLIAVAGPRVPLILGSFTDEKILADPCDTKLCYAISIGNDPEIHEQVRLQERQERAEVWFAGVGETLPSRKLEAAPKRPPQKKP